MKHWPISIPCETLSSSFYDLNNKLLSWIHYDHFLFICWSFLFFFFFLLFACIQQNPRVHKSHSIILRGANHHMLDEMERSVHDALCVVKRTLESNIVVPGGGSVEAALSIFLENFATTLVWTHPTEPRRRRRSANH
jgi:hypothetical protein